MKTAEEYLNKGFGEDYIKLHRNHTIELMENYAQERVINALKEAAEKAQLQRVVNGVEQEFEWKQIWEYDNTYIQVSKKSILSLIKDTEQ